MYPSAQSPKAIPGTAAIWHLSIKSKQNFLESLIIPEISIKAYKPPCGAITLKFLSLLNSYNKNIEYNIDTSQPF